MRTIHKVIPDPIQVPNASYLEAEIQVPAGATILSAHEQDGRLAVWYSCDLDNEPERVRLSIVPTGGELPTSVGDFVGTVLIDWTVWHVFRR